MIKKYLNKLGDKWDVYFLFIFIVSLAAHLYYSSIGWSHNLLDEFGFRQTQTAISTFYTIKDGFKINYITPVLGAPWSIPLEFPLFQWLVATIVMVFKTPLDQTGRFLNLLFFYLSLIPLYSILGLWLKKRHYKLIILSLILLNPTYLFWSRTFMIESLALFLSILFGWLVIKSLECQKKPVYFILAIAIGCLAALTKITTFIALGPALVFIFGYIWYKENENRFSTAVLKKYFSYGSLLFGVPLLAAIGWNHYADSVKSLNPLANGFITSKDLTTWNFGTIKQKISWSTWLQIFDNSAIVPRLFGKTTYGNYIMPNLLIFFVFVLYFLKKYRTRLILAFAFFLAGPLIFTNLYFIHNYYFYANSFFLSIFLGFFMISILEKEKRIFKISAAVIILPFFLLSLQHEYKIVHSFYQLGTDISLSAPIEFVSKNTNTNDIILIYGLSWDPSFSYYSQRKAIMDIGSLSLSDPKIKKSMDNLESEKIAAMVISEEKDEAFIEERTRALHLSSIPDFDDGKTKIYLSN